jgi:hypothetical protein
MPAGTPVQVRLQRDELNAIDQRRRNQPDPPTRGCELRKLIRAALFDRSSHNDDEGSRSSRKSESWPSTKRVWSAKYQINSREFLRFELRRERTRAVVDIRRWHRGPDDSERGTEEGFAISASHLPAIIDPLGAALAEAVLANNERPQAATLTRSAGGTAS